ncbi:MAG: hypothetical protein ACQESR_13410 [Planctomycetota bacterium]
MNVTMSKSVMRAARTIIRQGVLLHGCPPLPDQGPFIGVDVEQTRDIAFSDTYSGPRVKRTYLERGQRFLFSALACFRDVWLISPMPSRFRLP